MSKTSTTGATLADEVRTEIDKIAGPLRRKRDEIDAKIEEHRDAIAELSEARKMIALALRPFEPKTTKPAKRPQSQNDYWSGVAQAKLDSTRAFLIEHGGEFGESFTRNRVAEAMREHEIEPRPSIGSLEGIFDTLRDEGIIRAEKVVKGGGMAYVLIGGTNGKA